MTTKSNAPTKVPSSLPVPFAEPHGTNGSFDTELDAMFAAAPIPSTTARPVKPQIPGQPEKENEELTTSDLNSASEEEEETDATGGAEEENGQVDDDVEADEDISDEDMDEEKAADMVLHGHFDKKRKSKVILEDEYESDEARSKRTIFLGNVPIAALTSRAVRKELLRHILDMSPYPTCTHVMSLRFRSVSFRAPTTDLSQSTGDAPSSQGKAKRRERARKFRELKGVGTDGDKTTQPPLTSQQKRKIAYIQQDVNERADAVNAYVRIGDPALVHQHRKATEPLDPRLTGAILSTLLARALDNTTFHERHIRADVVRPLAMHEIIEAGLDKIRTADGTPLSHASAVGATDPKRTVFVGNLDFEAHEEDVRALFERLVREERGPPPAVPISSLRLDDTPTVASTSSMAPSSLMKPGEWVQSVRIVRDRATQLGKGFAYVKFLDPMCVDEVIALAEAEEAFVAAGRPQGRARSTRTGAQGAASGAAGVKSISLQEGQEFRRRVKLNKRALRVSRCKSITGDERKRTRSQHGSDPSASRPQTPPKRPIPESLARARASGAPTPNGSSPHVHAMPEKARFLSSLSKEQRALAKKSDPDRQARRAQKKLDKRKAQKVASSMGRGRERVALPKRGTAKKITRAKSTRT